MCALVTGVQTCALPISTAYATIKGFEVMRALRKGQARPWCLQPGIRGEVRLEERAFGIGPTALTETMGILNHHFAAAALHAQSASIPMTAAHHCNRATCSMYTVSCPPQNERQT